MAKKDTAVADSSADGAEVMEESQAKPEHHLTVIHPFGNYKRGDVITDPSEIEAIKDSENAHHAHKVFPQE